MIDSSTSKDRRAQLAATVGFVFQFIFFGTLLTVGIVYESDVIKALAYWMFGGVLIWPVIAMVYAQRRRTAQEKLETEALKSSQQAEGATAIFDSEDEAYLTEKRRLAWLIRWLVPGAAVALAAYHLCAFFLLFNWKLGISITDASWNLTTDAGRTMAFVGGTGFLAFLFSRYTAGMARVAGWRLLRSGASYLAGNALACLIVLIAIGLQGRDLPNPEGIAAYIIRLVILVLGIEFVANFVLDFYRPRAAGQESRPAFDSRLLALITEPGGIARSIADAINYQFGFEVSTTWFYQLLKRAALPMLAFGVIALIALSSVLIIDSDEQVVVERFGKKLQKENEPLKPGLHFKAPWPMDVAYRSRVQQVHMLKVGNTPEDAEEYEVTEDGEKRLKPILWGDKHSFNTELMLVVASKNRTKIVEEPTAEAIALDESKGEDGKSIAVGLLMVSVDIQYRINNIHSYLYNYINPEEMVEAIAYHTLTDYAASVDVDQFIGPGREEIDKKLHEILQARTDEQDLGVEILFVGVQEAHPTDDVSKAFQEVVKAEQEKGRLIAKAKGEAEERLTEIAGSKYRAENLYAAIDARDRLAQDPNATEEKKLAANQLVNDLLLGSADGKLLPIGGEAASRLSEVRATVRASLSEAERSLTLFNAELAAYQAAPRLYKIRKYLNMLERSLVNVRKYVVVADPDKHVIIEYEKEEKSTIDIGEAPKR